MNPKLFYGIPVSVLVVSFAVTFAVLELVKPEFVLDKKKSFAEDKVVNHVLVAGYSAAIAIAATLLYVLVANMSGKGYRVGPLPHTTMVIIFVFLVVYAVLLAINPEYLMDKDRKFDHAKAASFALTAGIIAGIIDYVIVSKTARSAYAAPSASCFFPSPGVGKQHYKMSFPARADEDM